MKLKMKNDKGFALMAAGISLACSLLATTAFAAPPKKKTPPKKTAPKVDKAAIAAGKKIYDANGCGGCHKVGDKGGEAGPNLSKVAAEKKHTAKWLETKVVDPKADDPMSKMPAYKESVKGKDLKNLVAYLGSLK